MPARRRPEEGRRRSPAGTTLSASIDSANDLAGCTAAQFSAADFTDPTCPAGSEIGTSSIVVPQIGTLSGKVYLAQVAPTGAIAGCTWMPRARSSVRPCA